MRDASDRARDATKAPTLYDSSADRLSVVARKTCERLENALSASRRSTQSLLDTVSQPSGVEAVLQLTAALMIELTHINLASSMNSADEATNRA